MSDVSPTPCPTCGRPLAAGEDRCPFCATLSTTQVSVAGPAPEVVAGRYELERVLGRGGAKEVWLARDRTLERRVALSRARDGAAGALARERMQREARFMARLGDHPHVVTVHDAVRDGDALYIVARYMAGGSLAARLAATPGRRLAVAEVLRTGRALADALAHVHAHGVVHRDVKPDNVWLDAAGAASLGDFGIAAAVGDPPQPGAAATGTPYFVAPEQAAGAAPEPASDLYALGATLWQLLVGHPPFRAPDAAGVLALHRSAEPEPPSRLVPGISAALDALLLALLRKTPAGRPDGAAAVRDALDRLGAAPALPAVRVPADREQLIGREAELAVLLAAGERAWAGAAGLAAVEGEPGIGKSRLVDEVVAEAVSAGVPVVRGRAGEESRAYGPWRGALRPLLAAASGLGAPTLDDLRRLAGDGRPPAVPAGAFDALLEAEPAVAADDEDARLRMYDAVAGALDGIARDRGLLIVLEDLHDADRSSLLLLSHVLSAVPGAPLLILTSHRDDGLHAEHALPAVLEAAERDRRLTRVALRGLSPAAVARFLPEGMQLAPAALAELHARTDGNPFFARELIRLLAERGVLAGDGAELPAVVPDRVRELVGRRLAPLAPATRDVLAVAGVVGRPFTIAGVARVTGLGREAVAEALAPALAGRLVEARLDAPGRYGFAHALVRDAVYAELAPADRARRHAAVREVLVASLNAGGEATAADAAHHALEAARFGGDPQPAWALAREAASEAASLQAHAEAAASWAGALEALELGAEATAAERLEAAMALATSQFAAGDIGAARDRFRVVATAARRAGDAELRARAALGFAEMQQYAEIDTEAITLLESALDALPGHDGGLRARLGGLLGLRLDPVSDQPRREALLDESVTMARRLGDTDTLVALLSIAAMVNWPAARLPVRAAATDELLGLTGHSIDRAALLWARTMRMCDALELGETTSVELELDAVRRLAGESRRPYLRWCMLVLQAAHAQFVGRLAAGERLTEEAVALNRRGFGDADQEHSVQRLALAIQAWRPQDIPVKALRDYATRYAALPVWAAMAAQAEWALGNAVAVRRLVEGAARDGFAALLGTPDRLCGAVLLAEPVAALGTPAGRDALIAALAPHADRNAVMDEAWAAFGPVARVLGHLAAARGEPERAADHFAHAVELAAGWGAPGWELRALGEWLAAGVPVPRPEAVRDRALALAGELELPHVAAELSA